MWLIEAALSDPSSSGTVICGAAAPETTVVVGVDDVHLLDELSTFVLHQIVARRAAKVVLAVRDGEPIACGTQELWKAGQFERLDLQPLGTTKRRSCCRPRWADRWIRKPPADFASSFAATFSICATSSSRRSPTAGSKAAWLLALDR
jgi:hypothetical protein